ncbi:MAG: formate dehydrogenase subunit gamma [Pseudomonadota bacterium]
MATAASNNPVRTRRRVIVVCLAFLLFLTLTLPLLDHLPLADASGHTNPRAELWRQVREGVVGYTAVTGQETGVLIQGTGQVWRQLRNGPLATYGAWLLAVTVFALGFFYLLRGQVKLTEPRTGITVLRWTLAERILHWYTALLFIVLGITGLSLLYGRAMIIPLIGKAGFSAYAEFAKLLHNFLGPLFIVGLLLMFAAWARDNIPNRLDIQWLKSFGGMIGHRHPSAERMNAGEKAWFWLLVFAGLAVSVSGLILDFPNFEQGRFVIQIAHLLHASLAIVLVAASLAHIYIGTVGTQDALEGMVSGRVDAAWAKQHHDLWYEEIRSSGVETVDRSECRRSTQTDAN